MKLKVDEEGHAVLADGNPVYVTDDGTEKTMDVAAMAKSLSEANAQAASQRTELKEAKARLSLFGDVDPSEAKKALAFREALGKKDLDPDNVATQIAELEAEKAGLTTQVEEKSQLLNTANSTIDELSLGAKITGSDFIRSKVAPALRDPGLFRAAYGEFLHRDESGNVVVKDASGNTIMSESQPGKPASLDEALPKVVTNPHHLAAGNASGGNERGNKGDSGGGGKRKAWTELDRGEQTAAIREHGGLAEAQAAFK